MGRVVRINCPADGEWRPHAYQADDARGGLLITNEKKTLSSGGGPGDVAVGSLGRLLGVVSESLGLDGVGAEEEEFLASDEVPVEWG